MTSSGGTAASAPAPGAEYLYDDLIARSAIRSYTFKAPVAGADWTITVPGGLAWLVVSLSAQLSCGGAVATRTPTFVINVAGSDVYATGAINQLAAGNAATFTMGLALGYAAALAGGSQQQLGVPALVLPAGSTIKSLTANLQAADTWTTQGLYVREAIIGNDPLFPDNVLVSPPLALT